MIKRFSLYGFLKNQKYYEPFIILFFLEKGLSFTQIGFLTAFRELCINITEIPSGALADLYGRRRCMMLSFLSYILSFILFASGQKYLHFFLAMFFFAIGEAFRTGTHKAMIFTWLRLQGRLDEKTKVYGYTRSWSKLGSALSIILATLLVLWSNNYTSIFYYSIIPYVLGLLNFMAYPKELDGQPVQRIRLQEIFLHLRESLCLSMKVKALRRLVLESIGFEGVFKAVKDYLQPILKNMALLIPLFFVMDETRRSAILVGAVYFVLHLASAYASRNSYKITEFTGGEENGACFLWKLAFLTYLILTTFLFIRFYPLVIAAFIGLYLIQNFWRPILISRFAAFATETRGATVLSIESQAKTTATMIIAPILGMSVDLVKAQGLGGEFWPVGATGALVAIFILCTCYRDLSGS